MASDGVVAPHRTTLFKDLMGCREGPTYFLRRFREALRIRPPANQAGALESKPDKNVNGVRARQPGFCGSVMRVPQPGSNVHVRDLNLEISSRDGADAVL